MESPCGGQCTGARAALLAWRKHAGPGRKQGPLVRIPCTVARNACPRAAETRGSKGPVCVLAWPACRKRVETSWKQSVAGADSLYCPHGMPARPIRKQLETWGPARGTRGGNIWKHVGNKGPSCGFPVLTTQNWVGPLCTDSGNKWKQVWKQAPVCGSTTLAV